MAQKYQIEFDKKTIQRFELKMQKIQARTKRFVEKDLLEFLEAKFRNVFLKTLFREIIKLAAKFAAREAIVAGAGAAAGATGVGAPAGGAIIVIGNVVLIVWTVVDAGLIIYNFRTVLREKFDAATSAIKNQVEALKQVPEGVRKSSRAIADRFRTDFGALKQVPEGVRSFGKAFKNRGKTNLGVGRVIKGEIGKEAKKRTPDFAFKEDAKIQAPDLVENLIDKVMGDAIREAYKMLIKEWAKP